MDPLSISASIVGLITASAQVSRLLKKFTESTSQASSSARAVLMEVTGIRACLHQLHDFLLGHEERHRSRRSFILIEQVIVVFTDCVTVFSELERMLEGVKTSEHMPVIDRVKWAGKEATVSRILARLQASKSSLNLMLTISSCASIALAETSMRNLAGLVQDLLHSNINMATRLKSLERTHPAFASSESVSQIERGTSETSDSRAVSHTTHNQFAFEEELAASTVYKRALLEQMRASAASRSSNGRSWFSGLSVSEVSNVSAVSLPIYRTELWNHQHYTFNTTDSRAAAISLDAWYNPPAKKSAFIRTAYFNGQYTNQYAQSKFIGHLVYRRFTILAPNSRPVFTEGAALKRTLEKIGEEELYELEDTAINTKTAATNHESPEIIQPESHRKKTMTLEPEEPVGSDQQTQVASTQPCPAALDSGTRRHPVPLLKRKAKMYGLREDQVAQLKPSIFRTSSPSCSFLCEEDESVLPKRVWKKPLTGMGSAEGWRLELFNSLKEIVY